MLFRNFLFFKDTVFERLKAQAEINEINLMRLSDLEQKINILDTRMDHLENSISQLGQALVEGTAIDPDEPF